MNAEDDRPTEPLIRPEGSPWADAKDVRAEATRTYWAVDKYAQSSTSKVLGPLATKSLHGIKHLFDKLVSRWTK